MRSLHAATALGLVLVAGACWHDNRATGPNQPEATSAVATPASPSAQPATTAAPAAETGQAAPAGAPTASATAAPAQERRAFREVSAHIRNSRQWRNASWVGEMHTEMMNEFARNPGAWLGADQAGKCRMLLAVTQKYLGQIQQERGAYAGRSQRDVARQFVRKQDLCAGATPMSLAGALATAMQEYTYSPEDGEPVTGDYQTYVSQVESAVQNGWTPSGIANDVNAILNSASWLPDPDLQVVYASASLALESTYYWYDFEMNGGWSGGSGGGGGGGGGGSGGYEVTQTMSLFGSAMQKSWGTGAAVDAISCGIGMADKYWLGAGGPVGWKILAGACALYGGGGSLLYAIS